MGGFTLDTDALVDFAKQCERHGGEMERLAQGLQQAHIGRDSFGHIPSVGSKIYQAYDEHVEQCEQAAVSAGSAVHSIAANVALTAATYLQAEQHSTIKPK